MKPRAGQVWIRRLSLVSEDIEDERLHVTLAYLGDGRFVSLSLAGEILLWPKNSVGPDFKLWEPLEGR